jgi:hypothetical protein
LDTTSTEITDELGGLEKEMEGIGQWNENEPATWGYVKKTLVS